MSRTTVRRGSRHGAGLRARLLAALLTLAVLPSLAGAQSVEEKYRQHRERMSRFNLASSPTAVLAVNQFQCGLNSEGDTCTDVFDSPTGGGGFWPTGSPNQYMFNSGLQVVGMIPANAGFAWAGDTVGAFFMDASGNYAHGTAVTEIYNSLDPVDIENWPTPGSIPEFPFLSGIIDDEGLFNDVLIGRKSASQQDSWVAYWDGDPNKTGGRTHPMGIMVEQRTMAWNYPEGAESVVFLLYEFTNVTNNPTFQQLNETKYGIQLPDAGWKFDSIYVAYDSDPDVGASATNNYATGIPSFDLGLAYEGPFQDDAFIYPSSLFHPPFFPNAPGIVGMKYLKSPTNPATGEEVGLTSLSQHTNGGAFPDPNTVQRGWRYISLNVDAGKGDPSCSFPQAEVRQRRACYLSQSQSDVRLFIGSGPFSLGPGESATIAVAMYAAATVATPEIIRGGDNKPGIPAPAPGCNGDPVRPIERAAGWLGIRGGCPLNGEQPDQRDVEVVPGSLLDRGLVAQAIFDNKFLLGFAPEAPPFYLVPGDNRVTVVWEESATEENGDPFIAAASDPTNDLYDPNYREFDVEGYRIYRGTSPANMQLIAQFDKEGSVFTDVTCITDPTHITTEPCTDVHEVDIVSPFVQYTTVTELASGDALVLSADTALNGQIAANPQTAFALTNTGIPFAYIDTDVRNGFQYFYKVTAFDVNSVRSVPSSLESAAGAKSVVPRGSPATQFAAFNSSLQGGTKVLDPTAPLPTIHPQNGTFSGPMPPTNGLQATFAPLVERLLPQFTLRATIDSVIPLGDDGVLCANGSNWLGTCWNTYVTYDKDGQKQQIVQNGYTPTWTSGGDPLRTTFGLGGFAIHPDAEAAALFGIPAENVTFNAQVAGTFLENIRYSSHENQQNRRALNGGNNTPGGSRWFSGANETVPDPARFIRVGHVDGVDTIFAPISHTAINASAANLPTTAQCFPYALAFLGRAADVEFRMKGTAAPEVFDVTHNVPVLFKPSVQASYGFLVDDANGNGVIDWQDFNYIRGASQPINAGGVCTGLSDRVSLQAAPKLVPVTTAGTITTTPMTPTGQGFGLYVNGERYIFQMATIPTATWTLRTYAGYVQASSGALTEDPSGYTFTAGTPRPPLVPGLSVVFSVEQPSQIVASDVDITAVHTVPDPYYAVSQFDRGPQAKELRFVNLPPEATVRIYSLSGVLVDIITHNDPTGGGSAVWDLRNRSNQFVASGVYLFHVSTPDGREHVGKFTVVNAGFGR